MSDLAAALMVAIRTHIGRVDKQGEPCLLHVLRVVEAVSDEAKVVAALHDVFEETGRDPWEGLEQAPLNLSTIECLALALLTRNEEKTYAEYVDLIAETAVLGDLAREVKLADLRDNLGRIPTKPGVNHSAATRRKWADEWGSLARRYSQAIATLEAPQ